MFYTSWTPSYTAPSESGITAGTMSVPIVKSSDWYLVKEDTGDVIYRTTSVEGSVALSAEVHIQNDVKNNPYGNINKSPKRPIPVQMQAAGLQMANVYVNLEDWGISVNNASDNEETAVIPLKMSLSINLPIGAGITLAQIQEHCSNLLAQVSSVSDNAVVPFGKLTAMAGGGIRI